METRNHTITLSFNWHTFVRLLKWILVVLAVGLLITLFVVIKSLLITFIISILLAFLLDPLVRITENYDIKRVWAIIIVFASIAFVVALGAIFLSPVIKTEIQTLSMNFQLKHPSVLAEEFKTTIEEKFPLMKKHGLSYDIATYIHHIINDLLKESFNILFEFVHFISLIFIIPVFTFFLLKDSRRIKKMFIQLVPNCCFEMTLSLVHKIGQQIGSYIRGQLLDAFIVGILSSFTLYLLNIRYAFLIGSIAGCANIIPHFGPVVGAVPAIIISLMETGSFKLALVIAASFAVIQLIDYLFISHMVVFKHIHMHPIILIVVVFMGGYLMGMLGMFVAVLFVSILKMTVEELAWGFKHYHIFNRSQVSSSGDKKV